MVIGEIRPEMAIIYNKELYLVLSCEHAKLARGAAFCRVKLRNIKTDQAIECTLRDSDNVEKADVEKRPLQYVFSENELYHFLTMDTYEDLVLHLSHIEDKVAWLKDNLEINGLFYSHELIDLELPLTMELKVIETEPGYKGDTVRAGTKFAKLETGVRVNVPLFIAAGDTIKVDTRNKTYMSRA